MSDYIIKAILKQHEYFLENLPKVLKSERHNGEYPHLFDEPWQVHPDVDTPINDLPDDGKVFEEVPF